MVNDSSFSSSTRYGTAGGLLTVLLINIGSTDIAKTILLAAIGAIVSFVVSLLLRALMKWWKR